MTDTDPATEISHDRSLPHSLPDHWRNGGLSQTRFFYLCRWSVYLGLHWRWLILVPDAEARKEAFKQSLRSELALANAQQLINVRRLVEPLLNRH